MSLARGRRPFDRSVRHCQNWSFASDMGVVAAVGWIENLHMLRYQSYKFELRPTGEQLRWMRRIAGCCRFVFNLALATQKDRVETGLAELDFARLSAQLLAWRRQPESIWLADVPIGYLHQALRNLERSYDRFNSAQNQAPKFKKRGRSDSFRCCNRNDIKIDQANSRILLPKLGWVRYRNSREMHGRLTNVTISVAGDKWAHFEGEPSKSVRICLRRLRITGKCRPCRRTECFKGGTRPVSLCRNLACL